MSHKLRFIKQDQPKFIQQFKQRVGLKHEPSLEDKVQSETANLEDLPEKDDEKPVVVVLKQGDLTAEEAAKEAVDTDEVPVDGKIKFRKPTVSKRSTTSAGLSATSKRKANSEETPKDETDVKSKKKKKTGIKSKSLLSFTEEDEVE